MARAAIITDGVVTNIIVADEEFANSIGAIICDENVSIGWSYVDGEFTSPESPEVDLNELKTALKASIDTAAEIERLKYITPGAGQALTYQTKVMEAQRYIDTDGAGEYPLLSKEIGITGDTLAGVVGVIIDMHNQWLSIGGDIEQVRLDAKAKIDAAEDEETARSIIPVWPNPDL